MNPIDYRIVETFPEPDFTRLADEAFSDFGQPSQLLRDTLDAELLARAAHAPLPASPALRIGAFSEGRLVGWIFARVEAGFDLHMVNSGVARAQRRAGVYSQLVQLTIEQAAARGYRTIKSRHVPTNNAVLIPKLRLGFQVSGFEYSEVYGPLVHLVYLVGHSRRVLHQARATPIVPAAGNPAQG